MMKSRLVGVFLRRLVYKSDCLLCASHGGMCDRE